mmetsp:Transcript_2107/g.3328  ORF Transcript_2107/g.3328 Transcript_2107/m.3328 type:complete len:221 (+) Transcript_2107:3508-4170(+)
MSITPSSIRNEQSFVLSHCLGKGTRPFFIKYLLERFILLTLHVNLRHNGINLAGRITCGSKTFGCTIDKDLPDVLKQFLSTILFFQRRQQVRILGNKPCGYFSIKEIPMVQYIQQERFVCLHATNTKLSKGTNKLGRCGFAISCLCSNFHKKTVVVWCNLSTRKSRSVVQSNAKAGRHSEHVNSSCVRPEVVSRVFGCDSTLHRIHCGFRNRILGQPNFR